jgi:hypothetical protein
VSDAGDPGGEAQASLLLLLCHVCGEPLLGTLTHCNNCDRPFHLRQRADEDGRECGEVWINEQYLTLEYACDVCLGKAGEPGAEEPPVGMGH